MYIFILTPLLTNGYAGVRLFQYALSNTGRDLGGALGMLMGVIFCVPFTVIKTLLDGIVWLYQDVIIANLNALAIWLGRMSPLADEDFDFQKNAFIGKAYMASSTIVYYMLFVCKLVFNDKFMLFITGMLSVILSALLSAVFFFPVKILGLLCLGYKYLSDTLYRQAAFLTASHIKIHQQTEQFTHIKPFLDPEFVKHVFTTQAQINFAHIVMQLSQSPFIKKIEHHDKNELNINHLNAGDQYQKDDVFPTASHYHSVLYEYNRYFYIKSFSDQTLHQRVKNTNDFIKTYDRVPRLQAETLSTFFHQNKTLYEKQRAIEYALQKMGFSDTNMNDIMFIVFNYLPSRAKINLWPILRPLMQHDDQRNIRDDVPPTITSCRKILILYKNIIRKTGVFIFSQTGYLFVQGLIYVIDYNENYTDVYKRHCALSKIKACHRYIGSATLHTRDGNELSSALFATNVLQKDFDLSLIPEEVSMGWDNDNGYRGRQIARRHLNSIALY